LATIQIRGGCIGRPHEVFVVRPSGGFHQSQIRAAKSVVNLMTLGGLRRAAFMTNVEPFEG
jgi:hypothetical protein